MSHFFLMKYSVYNKDNNTLANVPDCKKIKLLGVQMHYSKNIHIFPSSKLGPHEGSVNPY